MKSKFTGISILFLLLNITSAQNKNDSRWYIPSTTKVQAYGNYSSLPYSYVHPNTITNVVKTNTGITLLLPPNYRPFPSTSTESGVAAVTEGGNQNFMFAGWNSILLPGTFYETGWAWTSNGGAAWTGNVTTVSNIGDPGPWVWSTNSSFPGRLGMSYISNAGSIGATFSSDGGATWAAGVNFPGVSSAADKNLSAVDDITGSPFLGRAYTVYTDFGGANINRICISYSTNGGVSWSAEAPVSPAPASGHQCQGCDCVVGPGGVLYVCWANCISNGQNSTEQNLGFAKSTDGGVTWSLATNTAVATNGIRTSNLLNGCRANGFPRIAVDKSGGARNGYVYCTMCEKTTAPARDNADCCFMRSTDGGVTWTHTLVNSDAAGPLQWHSAITVDQTNGTIAIGYYDQRNTGPTQAQYYVSISSNGGNNWADIQASDHSWVVDYIHSPNISAGYMGDYSGITWSNGKFFPFWNDPSVNPGASLQQVWTCALNPIVLAHDFSCGPFLSVPQNFYINLPYDIKAVVSNVGSSAETNVPINFYVDGTLINTTNVSETAGHIDSVTNTWQTGVAGNHTLMYVSSLATDQDRTNDTVRLTINVQANQPPLCEQFTTSTFPPTNWTLTNGGTYWSWNSVSGFGVGSGSATYDMWDAPAGEDEALITYSFAGVPSSTPLNMDIAYAPYPSNGPPAQDSLIILASTDGGSTYSSIARLGPLNMETSPATDNQFTPAANEWKKISYVLPTGTNKLQFLGRSRFGNNAYIDSICVDNLIGIIHNSNNVPTVYSLSQNYPNPFNPATNINFAIPKAGLVKLVVYDILGRVVQTVVNEFKEAGTYKVNFDGTNLASGVYFYRMESADYVFVKKMLLIK